MINSDIMDSMINKYHIKSLLIGRKLKCIVNGSRSNIDTIRSYKEHHQLYYMVCVYINPLLIHVEKEEILKDQQQNIIGKIQPFGYMDDITIATCIMKKYPYTKTATGTQISIPITIQWQMIQLMQNTINTITYYLSINNIPQNEGKSHLITIHEDNYILSKTLIDKWAQPLHIIIKS